jgi:hypothetical protein
MIWLKLLGLFGWLKKTATALLGVAGRYPWQAALIASLCLSGWLWHGKGKAIGERDAARAETTALKASYVKAQADAAQAQRAADQANVASQTARNEKLELTYAQTETARRNAVADYIAGHRVRACPAQSAASGSAQAGVHPDPAEPADSTETAGLVTVTTIDLDSLTAGAVHGAKCTGFLNTLIAEGLAKAAD